MQGSIMPVRAKSNIHPWARRDFLNASHELVILKVDGNRRVAWFEMNSKVGVTRQLSAEYERSWGCPPDSGSSGLTWMMNDINSPISAFQVNRDELIYADHNEIKRLKNGQIDTLVQFDLETHAFAGMWGLPKGKELYYVLRDRQMPLSEQIQLLNKRGTFSPPNGNFKLFRLETGAPKVQEWDLGLASLPFTVDIAGTQVFRLSTSRGGISRIDLRTGTTAAIKGPGILPLGLTPLSGEIFLAWGGMIPPFKGITKVDFDTGEAVNICEFGELPALSPDRKSLAFLADDGLWLVKDGAATRIQQFQRFPHWSCHVEWCECGRYLAINIPNGIKSDPLLQELRLSLLIADTQEHEIAMFDVQPVTHHWKSCKTTPH